MDKPQPNKNTICIQCKAPYHWIMIYKDGWYKCHKCQALWKWEGK